MAINIKYVGVPVHKWVQASARTAKTRGWTNGPCTLEREDEKLERLFDKLAPLVQGGATLTLVQRVINAKPTVGCAYDVIDITVTQ